MYYHLFIFLSQVLFKNMAFLFSRVDIIPFKVKLQVMLQIKYPVWKEEHIGLEKEIVALLVIFYKSYIRSYVF